MQQNPEDATINKYKKKWSKKTQKNAFENANETNSRKESSGCNSPLKASMTCTQNNLTAGQCQGHWRRGDWFDQVGLSLAEGLREWGVEGGGGGSTDPQCQSVARTCCDTHVAKEENTRASRFDSTDYSQGHGIEFVNTPLEGTIQHITTGFTDSLLKRRLWFSSFFPPQKNKCSTLAFCQHHRFISDTTHTISSTSLCLSLQLLLPAAAPTLRDW